MSEYDYKAFYKAVKEWLIYNGYFKHKVQMAKMDITEDGKIYSSLFYWVQTPYRLENFEV